MDALSIALLVVGLALVAALLGVACAAGFVVANFVRFVAYLRYKGLPVPLPEGGLARALAFETAALLRVISWRLLPARAGTERPAPASLEGRPVLFVHGYWGTAADFRGLRRAANERGRPTYAVGLGPLHAPIEASARVLAEHIVRLTDRYRDRDGIDIVAHSLGGLVVRRTLMDHPELAERVKTLVTLGTPHAGTAATRGYVVGENVRQMRRRSRFLEELAPFESSCPAARVVTVAAGIDAIVYPHDTCHLGCARHEDLDGVGHTGLLVQRRAIDVVVAALTDEPAP